MPLGGHSRLRSGPRLLALAARYAAALAASAGLLGRVAAGVARVLSGELAVALLAVARSAAVGTQPVHRRSPAMRIPNRASTVQAETWSAQGSDGLWALHTAAASARLTHRRRRAGAPPTLPVGTRLQSGA